MRMVLTSALALVCAGVVVGAPLAFWSQRIAIALLDDLPSADWLPLVGAAAAMTVVALVAAFIPAGRASRVNPIEALRQE